MRKAVKFWQVMGMRVLGQFYLIHADKEAQLSRNVGSMNIGILWIKILNLMTSNMTLFIGFRFHSQVSQFKYYPPLTLERFWQVLDLEISNDTFKPNILHLCKTWYSYWEKLILHFIKQLQIKDMIIVKKSIFCKNMSTWYQIRSWNLFF